MCKIKKQYVSGINLFIVFLLSLPLFFLIGNEASAATLSLTPGSRSFEIGSTFDVSIVLNSEGKDVNAVKASLSFPANILQVASPSAGQSAVSLWASPPTYSNTSGIVTLEGGFPNGINTSSGLITKITFRVKSIGTAIIKFSDDSKVLLDDGKGTNALSQTNNGIYTLTLPAPAGPEIVSQTHPDQSRWYGSASPILKWADPDPDLVEEYSYVLSGNPTEIPDDVSEGENTSVAYKNIPDGYHYFHIKALNKDKIWGGTTHYALNIDSSPPADFSVDIFPASSTSRRDPVIPFSTTDGISSVDHYELKIVPLGNVNRVQADSGDSQRMFVEANSPYVAQNLELGSYDVIVRAYDTAGNYRDSTKRLKISNAVFQFVGSEGLVIGGQSVVSWSWFFSVLIFVILVFGYIIYRMHHFHNKMKSDRKDRQLPPEIMKKMEELKRLKEKYKNLVVVLILMPGFFLAFPARAETVFQEINPPLITTVSRDIFNNEIFYVGGKADIEGQIITIYIRNTETNEAFDENVTTDKRGEWFYRHDGFLSEGNYILWAQVKSGEQISPPSPQVEMAVNKAAVQFRSSRISYETLFFLAVVVLFITLLMLVSYIMLSLKRIRTRDELFKKEVEEIEDALHRGFMILHREMGKELKVIEKINSQKTLSKEENNYKEHLLNDLKRIEQHIEKEILDVEKLLI